jgi:hypothetical protein
MALARSRHVTEYQSARPLPAQSVRTARLYECSEICKLLLLALKDLLELLALPLQLIQQFRNQFLILDRLHLARWYAGH